MTDRRKAAVLPIVTAVATFGLLITLGANSFNALAYKQHYEAGLVALSLGKADDAQVELSLAIKSNPKSANAFYYLAQAEAERGAFGNALKNFAAALQLKPDSAKFHMARAALAMRMHNWSDAVVDCDAALAVDPAFVDAYSLKAGALNRLGLHEKAIEAATKFLNDYKADDVYRADALSKRALAQDKLGRYSLAARDYTDAIKYDPLNSSLYTSRAVVFMQAKWWNGAIADCNKSLAMRPNNPAVFKVRGICLAKLNLKHDALKDLNHLVALHESVDAHRIRGSQRYAAGDLLGSMQDFDYVLEAEPEDSRTTQQYLSAKTRLQSWANKSAAM